MPDIMLAHLTMQQ